AGGAGAPPHGGGGRGGGPAPATAGRECPPPHPPAVDRVGYEEEDVRRALTAPGLDGLPTHERFALAQVIGKGGLLRTASPRLLRTPGLPVEPIVREGARSPVEEPRGTRARAT
ncbi:DUF6190 family protein, partial [Streptomyces wedmorensis]